MSLLILFIAGLLFGSFGGVILGRLQEYTFGNIFSKKSSFWKTIKGITIGRSECDECKHTLQAADLIPIVSRLSTGGKCRYCKKKLSANYLLLEIGMGLVFMLVGWALQHLGYGGNYLYILFRCLTSGGLFLLLFHDIQTMNLHDSLWICTAVSTIILIILSPHWRMSIIWGAWFWLFFLGVYRFGVRYVKKRFHQKGEGFGLGDVRLAPIVGAIFGIILSLPTTTDISLSTYFSSQIAFDHFMLFRKYVIGAGVIGLLYALILKMSKPEQEVASVPYFPGMIIALIAILVWVAIFLS